MTTILALAALQDQQKAGGSVPPHHGAVPHTGGSTPPGSGLVIMDPTKGGELLLISPVLNLLSVIHILVSSRVSLEPGLLLTYRTRENSIQV